MVEYKLVTIPKGAFLFCKFTLSIILWLAVIFRWEWLAVASFCILAGSAILKIDNAPLVILYRTTVERIWKSPGEVLDEKAMCFAHSFGAVINFIGLVLLFTNLVTAGWVVLFCLAVVKTIGTLGFCPASKLYTCITSGGCCRLTKRNNGC